MLAVLVAFALSAVAAAAATDTATKELYAAQCQACHMSDGKAAIPEMNLADGKWLHGTTVAALTKVISDGVPGKAMLPFKDRLTPQQIDSLARYVRTFDKALKPAPKTAPKAGAKAATPAPRVQASAAEAEPAAFETKKWASKSTIPTTFEASVLGAQAQAPRVETAARHNDASAKAKATASAAVPVAKAAAAGSR
jgi:mono/diheme cytochrome c family protein